MSEKVRAIVNEALKEKLFARTTEIEIEGVKFKIRRLTRREYLDKLSPYVEKLMILQRNPRPENATEIARLNLEYERELVRLCVVEPDLGENPDEWMDGRIWLQLINAIHEFIFPRPLPTSSQPLKSTGGSLMIS